MSGVLKTISKVAGIIAVIAPFFGPIGMIVAAVATAVSVVTGIAAKLTEKKPAARGSASSIIVSSDGPMSCIIGRTYAGGQLMHDVGYGPTLKDVPNPYRAMVIVYSIGLCAALEGVYADFTPVTFSGVAATGYYAGFMYRDFKLGAIPEATAMTNPISWGAIPGWSSSHKLSGKAAIMYSLKFDRDGKRYASGVPQLGAIWQGVACYDPRKDSTYPGGSGAHRWAPASDRSAHDAARATWEYSENPGLHGLHYALGRYQRDTDVALSNYQKVMGIGIPFDGVEVSQYVAFANICDANGWKVGGVLLEPGEGVRWNNLKDILAAGGAEPTFIGGRLGVAFDAPGVAIDTITASDLADDDCSVTGQASYRTRLNGIIPKFRSEDHKWEYVASEKVTVASYVIDDGEERVEQMQWNLVQNRNQAAQLAAYELVNRRELGDIQLVCKPRMRRYGPGTRLLVNIPELGLTNQLCEIRNRTIDPGTLKVSLILRSETASKHAFALGKTGTAPPTPTLVAPSVQDDLASAIYNSVDFANVIGVTRPADNATRDVFRGVHNTASAYVAGDFVSNAGNTANYKAKQAVPAGIALTNNAYWDVLIISSGGAAGANAFNTSIEPPVISVATTATGTGGAYPQTAQLTIREGSVNRTASSTFAVVGSVPWASVGATGLVTVTDPGVPFATAQFDVTYGAVVYRVTLQALQHRAGVTGAAGANSKLVTLAQSAQFFVFNEVGQVQSQTITFTATRQNTTAQTQWALAKSDGTLLYSARSAAALQTDTGVFTRVSDDVVTMTQAQYTAYRAAQGDGYTLQASINDGVIVADAVEVRSVASNAIVATITNSADTVAADAAGTVASFAGLGGTMSLVLGGSVPVTAGVTYSVFSQTGVTIVITAGGVYAPTAMSADTGTAILRATYKGNIFDQVYTITKSRQGASGTNGTNGAPGTPGVTGNKTIRVFQRAPSQPAMPSGTAPPAGWTLAVPAANGNRCFASEVETQPDGVTPVGAYTTPVVFEATVSIGIGQSTGYAGTLVKALAIGESLTAEAVVLGAARTGGSAAYTLTLQIREMGGTYAPFGTAGIDSAPAGDPLFVSSTGTFVNSAGEPRIYEITTTLTKTGPGVSTIRANASYLRV